MIEINIDLSNTLKNLQNLQNKVSNMTPLMANIAEDMYEAVIDNFDAQGRPKWAALSSLTKERRKRMGYDGKPILENSGELRNHIIFHSTKNEAVVGTNKTYAALQHFGSAGLPGGVIKPKKGKWLTIPLGPNSKGKMEFRKVKQVKVPARPFLTLSDADFESIHKTASQYFDQTDFT
jgi:phage virion morphogenesis protein